MNDEEGENIKNWLYNEFKGTILRYATKGLPEYYKDYLLKRGFKNDKNNSRKN